MSSSDGSDEEFESDASRRHPAPKRLKKAPSAHPAKVGSRQRQASTSQAPSEKPKPVGSAQDDALRKFSLSRLEEIMLSIFKEYGIPQQGPDTDEGEAAASTPISEQPTIEERAKAFANELERCMIERYAEPDKSGKMIAHNKYKYVVCLTNFLGFHLPALLQGTLAHVSVQSTETRQSRLAAGYCKRPYHARSAQRHVVDRPR